MVSVPNWVTHDCFNTVCGVVSVRDATEYKRRFERMAAYLTTGKFREDHSITTWMVTCEGDPFDGILIQDIVSQCRMAYGVMLEAFARQTALDTTPIGYMPSSSQSTAKFARICSDAYMAALWTDAHAQYSFNLMESNNAVKPANVHSSFGVPCVRLTASISSLPLISTQLENYVEGKTYTSATTKELLSVISRCTQSGSRGWEPALKAGLSNDVVKRVCSAALVACCIGMHPQLHPACRPTWEDRFISQTVIELAMGGHVEDVLCQCNVAVKESIRIYMCSLLNDTPASRAARFDSGNGIGLLTSCPLQLTHPALQAASQNIVKAGINATKAIGELEPTADKCSKVKTLVGEILNCIGMETRCRKRQAYSIVCNSSRFDSGTTNTASIVGSKNSVDPVQIAYVPSWINRAHSVRPIPQKIRAISVANEMMSRCFRANFVPIWVHAHGNGIRASRFAPSQQQHVHETSPTHLITRGLDEQSILKLYRQVARDHLSYYKSVSSLASLVGVDEQIVSNMSNCSSIETAIELVSSLSARHGALFLTYCKIASLKEKILCYDLGSVTKEKQLRALRLRFDLHESEDVESDLPQHARFLYWCLQCGRVPNACVEASSRAVPHNEVGLAQTMLRVGPLGGGSDVRCARRSSAALRTALQKEEDAKKCRIDKIDVTESAIAKALKDNGDVSHAARLRRDVKSCSEQHPRALACGDECMVKIPLVGHCVRVHSKWYSICCYCASVMHIEQSMRFGQDLCCGRCDPSMLESAPKEASSAAQCAEDTRAAGARVDTPFGVVPDAMLSCRFCGKPPPTSGSAKKFKIVRSPRDSSGRNCRLPPPLRTVAYCSTHYRSWVEHAHQHMDVRVILAHISEKASPVFGADTGKRGGDLLRITDKSSAKPTSKVTSSIAKRMRANGRSMKARSGR